MSTGHDVDNRNGRRRLRSCDDDGVANNVRQDIAVRVTREPYPNSVVEALDEYIRD